MRSVLIVMSCLAVGAAAVAVAQTAAPASSSPAPAAATSTTATAPAAPAAAATPAKAPTVYPDDKRMISKGYKPEMRGEERMYCRKEDQVGTHLPPVKTCVSAAQAAQNEKDAKEYTENSQRMANPPKN